MDELFTTHDVSRLLQVDPSTVSKWIDKGILMAFRTPGRHRRVRSTDLRNFLIAHQMPVPEELGGGVIRLLIVDDERPVLDGLKRAFKPFVPDLDGFEVCRRIRARKQLESVKLVTMTARHSPELLDQSIKAGAVTCLSKPIDAQRVMDLFRVPLALGTKGTAVVKPTVP